ncbi:MAG TPA: hypothetical protein DCL41_02850 [Bdellovibrionales bacterium]|nr:hypothetical protein [Pseudobdellovibrionaceae bacterium]HAG90779.1 hypothetical protein [Bdellovibrionales bacterium]|tara:strand:+ start:1355 stop:1852 length:498 start_codon:yes stop_codon:yes gene_type:complete
MYSATRTESKTGHAARVARKILGDLQSLVRLYECSSEETVRKYAHDIEIGIDESCLSHFKFYLCSADGQVLEAYEYIVKENGEVEESSASSGRHSYNPKLDGSNLEIQVFFRDRQRWEELKKEGVMEVSWSPGEEKSLAGLSSQDDGAYKSGLLGVTRTSYRRPS